MRMSRVVIGKDAYTLKPRFKPGFEYTIEKNKCRSYQNLVSWIAHLTEEIWIDFELLNALIVIVCKENNLEM